MFYVCGHCQQEKAKLGRGLYISAEYSKGHTRKRSMPCSEVAGGTSFPKTPKRGANAKLSASP